MWKCRPRRAGFEVPSRMSRRRRGQSGRAAAVPNRERGRKQRDLSMRWLPFSFARNTAASASRHGRRVESDRTRSVPTAAALTVTAFAVSVLAFCRTSRAAPSRGSASPAARPDRPSSRGGARRSSPRRDAPPSRGCGRTGARGSVRSSSRRRHPAVLAVDLRQIVDVEHLQGRRVLMPAARSISCATASPGTGPAMSVVSGRQADGHVAPGNLLGVRAEISPVARRMVWATIAQGSEVAPSRSSARPRRG